MRVSELAKELGYRAAELVEMAKGKSLPIQSIRDKVDARKAALIRAKLPHRSKLDGDWKELYDKIVADLKVQEAEKKARKAEAPKTKRTRKAPAKKKTEEKKAPAEAVAETPAVNAATRAAIEAKKKETVRAVKESKEAAAEKKAKTVRKKKVVQEFHLGAEGAAKKDSPRTLPKIAGEAAKKGETGGKPLIDVEKVIGQEKTVRSMGSDMDQAERKKEKENVKRAQPRTAPEPPRPRGRRVKGPPIARPTVQVKKTKQMITPPTEREYTVQAPLTVKELSQALSVKVADIIRKLLASGQRAGMNSALDADTIELLGTELNRKVTVSTTKKAEESLHEEHEEEGKPEDFVPRPPVVTVLGHVDHGKTSLLDKIRDTSVADAEAGGITQHIGASRLKLKDGKEIVFLDTPGHEAFTAMRARGAQATDLVVLVVAADDGVMPQTEEAYNHAKAAEVPIIIALNKVDKAGSNVNKVKGQLAGIGLQTEDWGGSTSCVEVSALKGTNIEALQETILLEAELLELKANPKLPARGVVLEAMKTGDRGVVATILVQNGTLRKGDIVLTGSAYGRVRSMHDDRGKVIREAGPATPVELSGLDQVPDIGDKFHVVSDLKQAKKVVEERRKKDHEAERLERSKHVTLETLFSKIESGKLKEVKVVIKADAGGSAEVLKESLEKLATKEVKLGVLHTGVGSVSESDILLADASDAIVVAFYVDIDPRAEALAKDKSVQIKKYQVIYEAMEEMEAALEGLLEPEKVQVRSGLLAVKEVFRISRIGAIAGCLVTNGKIERNSIVRVVRNGKMIHEGKLESLKRFKDDTKEVAEGYECGVKIAGHDDIRVGDVIEAMEIKEVARKLERKK